ncbi:hypothetical protein OSJ79_22370, partial [Mycobacterium ulcerans]
MPVVAVPHPAVAAVPAETDEQRGTPAVAAGAAGISAAVGSSRAAGPAVADQQARVTAGPAGTAAVSTGAVPADAAV